ncbi:MAG: hypothetical protein IPH13_02855 [Planctomycetes bacterium]|nr:hypothetical protein [Planctomycetota bacterium]MCC7172175.1 hypothetical protein [Planctomycetota bacterium]
MCPPAAFWSGWPDEIAVLFAITQREYDLPPTSPPPNVPTFSVTYDSTHEVTLTSPASALPRTIDSINRGNG